MFSRRVQSPQHAAAASASLRVLPEAVGTSLAVRLFQALALLSTISRDFQSFWRRVNWGLAQMGPEKLANAF